MKYLKAIDPSFSMRGWMLVMKDIEVNIITIFMNNGNPYLEDSTLRFRRGEFVFCSGCHDDYHYLQENEIGYGDKRNAILRSEFEKIQTLIKGDHVEVKTMNGYRKGIAGEPDSKKHWVEVEKLEGTYSPYLESGSTKVRIEQILAISDTFKNI